MSVVSRCPLYYLPSARPQLLVFMRRSREELPIVLLPGDKTHRMEEEPERVFLRFRRIFRRGGGNSRTRVKHARAHDNNVSEITVGFAVAPARDQFCVTLIVDSRRTREGTSSSPPYI